MRFHSIDKGLGLRSISLLKNLLLIIYSPPCHPRCRKEIKVFDENIPGFSPYNGLQWEPNGSRSQGPNEIHCSFKWL